MGRTLEDAYTEVSETCLCFNLRRASRLITHVYDAELKASGLRTTQFTALVAVAQGGPISMQVLAARLGMDRTTLTRNLKGLQEDGLVASLPGRDRRSRLVSLTDKGREALKDTLPHWRAAQERALAALGPERLAGLMPALEHISDYSKAAVVTGTDSPTQQRGDSHGEC
jgi:DNA-binding MarR family transcriptional regulator